MALSLAEKALLLLYGAPPQGPAQRSASNVLSDEAERGAYSLVIGALLADALLQGRLRLRRAALFVSCQSCYLALVFGMLFVFMAVELGAAALYAAGILDFLSAVALAVVLLLLWGIAFIIIGYLITGRLSVEETVSQDEALALLLQRMRETGQGKTCNAYFRRLARFQKLREEVKRMRACLLEDGYVIGVKDVYGGIAGTTELHYTMNLEQPECQRLLDQFRAFLLDGQVWDEESAILAILLCPRLVTRNPRIWPQPRWYTWFTPEEYPRLRVRLKAIKAQRDQTMRTHLGATTYQALLTIRNLLP
jgi:hypothetical protein